MAAPPALLPEGLPQLGVFPFSALDEGLRDADVIILLPLSAEAVAAGRLPSPRDYAAGYRLSPGRWPWRGPMRCCCPPPGCTPASKPRWRSTPRWRAPATSGTRWSTRSGWRRCASCRTRWDARWPQGARMRLHIANGRLIDPAAGVDRRADLYIADGHVAAVDVAPAGFQADRRIEADGLAVLPGLVDLCARLAGPDGSPSPDALRAALAGGVTRLVQPPDGGVMLDDPARVHAFLNESPAGPCRIHAVGALTPGLRGEALAELRLLAQAGCLAFGQGEAGLSDTRLLWNAMRYAAGAGLAAAAGSLAGARRPAAGGAYAARLGLEGLPDLAETLALQTLFELQRDTGVRLHLSRLSSAAGLGRARAAKREGLPVSCDVSANHLHLTDVDIGFFDARYRLQPPLRGAIATRSAPRWPTAPSMRCARTIRR